MLPDFDADGEDKVDILPENGDTATNALEHGSNLVESEERGGLSGASGEMGETKTGIEETSSGGSSLSLDESKTSGEKKGSFLPICLGILCVSLVLMVTSDSQEGGFEETLPYVSESPVLPLEEEGVSLLEGKEEAEESFLVLEEDAPEEDDVPEEEEIEPLPAEEQVVLPAFTPKIKEMFSICELAVIETSYNNVAKYKEEKSSFFGKETHFWVEYTGIVQIGVDLTHVNIQLKDDLVTIHLPKTTVLSSKVDESSLTESSYIYGNKSKGADAAIQVEAIAFAQNQMFEIAMSDTSLLNVAQQRVQLLLESYIRNVGELTGVAYEILWIWLDENGKQL